MTVEKCFYNTLADMKKRVEIDKKRPKIDIDFFPPILKRTKNITLLSVEVGEVLYLDLKISKTSWYKNMSKYRQEYFNVKNRFNVSLNKLIFFNKRFRCSHQACKKMEDVIIRIILKIKHIFDVKHKISKMLNTNDMQFKIRGSSFRLYMRSFRAILDYVDSYVLYRDAHEEIYNILNLFISLRIAIITCAAVYFTKWVDRQWEVVQQFYFCSHAEKIFSRFSILEAIDQYFNRILRAIEYFIHNGSGWLIKHISVSDLNNGNYRAHRGDFTAAIQRKKNILNIKCTDNRCFLYCGDAAVYPIKPHACRTSK